MKFRYLARKPPKSKVITNKTKPREIPDFWKCLEVESLKEAQIYLRNRGETLGIKRMEDWYKIRKKQILPPKKQKTPIYGEVSPKILPCNASELFPSVFPEHKWLRWKFPNTPLSFWRNRSNQRQFIEWLGKELGFKEMKDWYSITIRSISAKKGKTLLRLYENSPIKLLRTVFPYHSWVNWKFTRLRSFRMNVNLQNEKNALELLEFLAEELKIQKKSDWYRISYADIFEVIPIDSFGLPLHQLLPLSYPEHDWDIPKLQNRSGTMKASQRRLEIIIQELLSEFEIKYNYHDPSFLTEKGHRRIELDVFVPEKKLAFEYQGEQHYRDIYALGYLLQQQKRDLEKKKLCESKGITLIEVPYWWDKRAESLVATIIQRRPDIEFPSNVKNTGIPIPISPPLGNQSNLIPLMHAEHWNGLTDLTGWWMSEKLDGVRAFWNGKELISKQSKKINCPSWFIEDLPKELQLDGELWMGRGKFREILGLLKSSNLDSEDWKNLKYALFDLPQSKLQYDQRVEILRNLSIPPHSFVVPVHKCHGNTHALQLLSQTMGQGGEGLMAIEPSSFYLPGRQTTLLKIKKQEDCEVQVLEILPTGLYCQTTNGLECVVGCFQETFQNPPEIGSVLTVQHNGFYQNGTLRNAFYWRHRSDMEWKSISNQEKTLVPFANWTNQANVTLFFESLRTKYGYTTLDDFYTITPPLLRENGGTGLIDYLFEGSIGKALQHAYPNHAWHFWKFFQRVPKGFWDKIKNKRLYMDNLAKDLAVSTMEDWYKVNSKDIMERGGRTLLDHYSCSPYKILEVVYPQHSWHAWRFEKVPKGFWDKEENQRSFMEWLGQELGFNQIEDWYKLRRDDILNRGGIVLLKKYEFLPSKLLIKIFPEWAEDISTDWSAFYQWDYRVQMLGNKT